jgi:hypothetical protein
MKKGELKNRLRRRTADKLYDLARSGGHVPAHLPAVADAARESARRTRARGKRPLGPGPALKSRG